MVVDRAGTFRRENTMLTTSRFRSVIGMSLVALACVLPARATPEPQNDDAAFALLIEAYRQTQTALIERDYQSRVRASRLAEDPALRRHVLELARQERDG